MLISKSPEAKKVAIDAPASGSSRSILSIKVSPLLTLNGQVQLIPKGNTCGGHFVGLKLFGSNLSTILHNVPSKICHNVLNNNMICLILQQP